MVHLINHYIPGGDNPRNREKLAEELGTTLNGLGYLARTRGKNRFALTEVETSARIARDKYNSPTENVEIAVTEYINDLGLIKGGRKVAKISTKKSCSICQRGYDGAFSSCPVCLFVLNSEFRQNLRHKIESRVHYESSNEVDDFF